MLFIKARLLSKTGEEAPFVIACPYLIAIILKLEW